MTSTTIRSRAAASVAQADLRSDATRESLYPYPAATRRRDRNTLYLISARGPDAHEPERVAETAASGWPRCSTTRVPSRPPPIWVNGASPISESLVMAAG